MSNTDNKILDKLECDDRKILFDITKFMQVSIKYLSPHYLDDIVYNYVKECKALGIKYVVLWPIVSPICFFMIHKMKLHGVPLYVKHYRLSYKNMCKFICLIYSDKTVDTIRDIVKKRMSGMDKNGVFKISFVLFYNVYQTDIYGNRLQYKKILKEYAAQCIEYKGNADDVLFINETDKQTLFYSQFLLDDSEFENLCK